MKNTCLWLHSSLTAEEMSICSIRDNEDSGGSRGAGSLNISLIWYPVFLIPVLYGNILCNVSQSRSITVSFGGTRRLPPTALPPPGPPALCPLCHLKASSFDYFDQQHSQAFPGQFRNVTFLQLLFTGCS